MADRVVFGDADSDCLHAVVPGPVFAGSDEFGGNALPSSIRCDREDTRFDFSWAAHLGQRGTKGAQGDGSGQAIAVGENEDLGLWIGHALGGIPQERQVGVVGFDGSGGEVRIHAQLADGVVLVGLNWSNHARSSVVSRQTRLTITATPRDSTSTTETTATNFLFIMVIS